MSTGFVRIHQSVRTVRNLEEEESRESVFREGGPSHGTRGRFGGRYVTGKHRRWIIAMEACEKREPGVEILGNLEKNRGDLVVFLRETSRR